MEVQKSDELFPAVDASALQQSQLEASRAERTAMFVSVVIGGKTIVFRDVLKTEWYAPFVRAMAEEGIVSGYRDAEGQPTGLFGPANAVTVGEMAKVFAIISGAYAGGCPAVSLNPTASGSWMPSFLSCGEKRGWAVYGDATVDVQRPATRAEVVMTLLQSFGIDAGEMIEQPFDDVTSSTRFAPAIAQAKRDNIVSGFADAQGNATGMFGPEDSVTRAEFAKIIRYGMQTYTQK